VLPGRYTTLWFQATQVGTYRLLCSLSPAKFFDE